MQTGSAANASLPQRFREFCEKEEFLFLTREDLVRTRPLPVDLPDHNSNPEVEKQRVNVFDNIIHLQASR